MYAYVYMYANVHTEGEKRRTCCEGELVDSRNAKRRVADVYAYVYASMHLSDYLSIYIYISINLSIILFFYRSICISIDLSMCTCIYIYMYICMYVERTGVPVARENLWIPETPSDGWQMFSAGLWDPWNERYTCGVGARSAWKQQGKHSQRCPVRLSDSTSSFLESKRRNS